MDYRLDNATEVRRFAPIGGNSVALADPALSPDGKRIAFVQELAGRTPQEPLGDLWVANRDGTDSHAAFRHGEAALRVISPQWIDDAHVLAVIRVADADAATYTLESIAVGTGERTRVLGGVTSFGVSRDHQRIVYTVQDQPGALWAAAADGSAPAPLIAPGSQVAAVASPRFSPDGRTVAFAAASAPSSPLDLYTMPSSGGQSAVLAALRDGAPSLTYSGDGRHIYVATARGLSAVDARTGGIRPLRDAEVVGAPQWMP
jgi:Tol biopolymer transport system component